MTLPSSSRILLPWLALVAGAALTGCAGSTSTATNGTATGSAGTSGCRTSACLPGLTTAVSWAVEIDPPSNTDAALTELADVDFTSSPVTLTADAQTGVSAAFTAGAGVMVPPTANVVLTVPPLIGGRPDLTFETAMTSGASTNMTASLSVPAGTLGRTSTLSLIPLSPSDQQSPPFSFSVTLAPSLAESLPAGGPSISGTLVSAIGGPPSSTFVARAFSGGTQVSNAPLTDMDGKFQLLLTPSAAGTSVIVELTPQNQAGGDPWYTSSPILPSGAFALDPILLPAYSTPNFFTVSVEGADHQSAVGGAFVSARSILASNAAGATDYQSNGTTTTGTGSAQAEMATLALLPGTAMNALDYDVTVIPPASSAYATHCMSPVGVTVGGTMAAPVSLLTVDLPRRPVLTGTLTDAGGAPVSNVAVTATAGSGPTDSCTNTPAVSSSTLTDAGGQFSLPLDPGTYQLDYDPPAGAAVPRLTEPTIAVAAGAGAIAHDVTLPAGVVVSGTVYGPDKTALASATVHIYEVRCSGQADCFGPTRTPPWLRGQGVTDASGTFRAVVAAPASGD
jgi:hypothetical protein